MKFFISFILISHFTVSTKCFKYKLTEISDLTFITKEGKQLWDSLSEKVNLPQYGTCWKSAISDLRIGCKYLSEDTQSSLALRFTDCFLQMSGYDPLICNNERDVCLRNLSDRAFNVYTEFYTHTQSICYFLQSQVWHEEAQKTIDQLTDTSHVVVAQLTEAEHTQKNILNQQKESLMLQHYLLENGKSIATALESSEEKISKIMKDFQDSALEHKQLLFELFEKLSLLKSWVVVEMSWINCVLFYMAAMFVAYLFTSLPSTSKARGYIFVCLTVNYVLERFIYSNHVIIGDQSGEHLLSWIWLCRKIFIIISILTLVYCAAVYCDYNIINHKLLMEVRNQNRRILSIFEQRTLTSTIDTPISTKKGESVLATHSVGRNIVNTNYTVSPVLTCSDRSIRKSHFKDVDDIDNASVVTAKSSVVSEKGSSPYNLRSRKEQV